MVSEGRRNGRRRTVGEWVLIAIALGYAAVLLVGPLVALVWGTFSRGLAAPVHELLSPDAIHALGVTLVLAAEATAINTVFGILAALVLVRDDFPGRRLLSGLIDIPFAVSPVIAGFMLIALFGRGGWLEPLMRRLGWRVAFAYPGMLLATVFVSLPFVVRTLVPVLRRDGDEAELTAYTIGAGSLATFRRVTLPALWTALATGVSLTFARAIGEFGALLVVSGNVRGSTETATLFIFRAMDDRNVVGAYAMALLLGAICFLLLAGMAFVRRRPGAAVAEE
jgi:sulfate/thiosulfate transport system permease protein